MVNIHSSLSIAALLSATNAAAILRPRDCSFTWPAEAGDTCQSMASAWGISVDQFSRWNSGINCNALVVGQDYCLLWDGPEPNVPTSSSKTATSTSVSSAIITTTTAAATPTPTGPSPVQEGIPSNCQKYHLAVSGDTCLGILSKYGTFSLQDFTKWNPAVGSECTGLWLGYYYCIAVPGTPTSPTATPAPTSTGPSPVQSGIASDCQRYHQVKLGDNCQGIVDTYRTFTRSQFYSWKPAVGTNCEALWLDFYVCIGVTGTPSTPAPQPNTPSPTQRDVNSKCNKWYQVVSGDYCQKIADQNNISLQNFYSWNPTVGNTCAGLWLGYYVCVGSA